MVCGFRGSEEVEYDTAAITSLRQLCGLGPEAVNFCADEFPILVENLFIFDRISTYTLFLYQLHKVPLTVWFKRMNF